MSFNLMQLLVRRRLGKGERASEQTRKAVAIVMADAANDDGTGIFLSVATIAARAACARRSVEYVLAELCGEGVLKRDGKRAVRGGAVVVWQFVVGKLEALPEATVTLAERDARNTSRRNTVTRNGCDHRDGVTGDDSTALRVTPPTASSSVHHVRTNPAPRAERVRTTCGQRNPESIQEEIHPQTPDTVTRNGRSTR